MVQPARKRRRRGADVTYLTIGNNTYIQPRVHRHVSVASSRQSVVSNDAGPSAPRDADNGRPDEPLDDAFEGIPPEFFNNISDMLEFVDRPRNRTASDNPLEDWRQHHVDDWLAELLRLEGRCGFCDEACASCHEDRAEYRCDDCNDIQLYCRECAVERHLCNPFHRLQCWSGTHFRRTTLKTMGLRIQLGHPPGVQCRNPVKAFADDFIILDVSGVNEVAVDYCGCETAQAKSMQLLRSRIIPATGIDPKTAATFRLMEFYHVLHNQSKVSGFEFYNTLSRRTDNTGTVEIKARRIVDVENRSWRDRSAQSRYTSFMRMARMWYHLKLLKRFGRGNDHVGRRRQRRAHARYFVPHARNPVKTYPKTGLQLLRNEDANFRLKRKKVSSDSADPGFNNGIAYFVEERAYKEHLEKH
ncbi:hypothetical protein EVJ58_g10963, partial [Rhodofomes roseus]